MVDVVRERVREFDVDVDSHNDGERGEIVRQLFETSGAPTVIAKAKKKSKAFAWSPIE